jgi:hypothetical protein
MPTDNTTRLSEIRGMDFPKHLELLARWFDQEQRNRWNAGDNEVQNDLRKLASDIPWLVGEVERLTAALAEAVAGERARAASVCRAMTCQRSVDSRNPINVLNDAAAEIEKGGEA